MRNDYSLLYTLFELLSSLTNQQKSITQFDDLRANLLLVMEALEVLIETSDQFFSRLTPQHKNFKEYRQIREELFLILRGLYQEIKKEDCSSVLLSYKLHDNLTQWKILLLPLAQIQSSAMPPTHPISQGR